MPTQLNTTTYGNNALEYPVQHKIAYLCDGTMIFVGEYATASGSTLYQFTTADTTPANLTSIQTFSVTSSTQLVCDLYVVDNGNGTNDVWVLQSSNAGASGLQISHCVYTGSGSATSLGTWGTWDGPTSCIGGVTGQIEGIASCCWTGGSLIVAFRGSNSSSTQNSVYLNYTTTKAGTSGWLTTAPRIASTSASGTSGTPLHYYPVLEYDPTLDLAILLYVLSGDKIVVRTLGTASSTTPTVGASPTSAATGNWSAETTAVAATINSAAQFSTVWDTTAANLHLIYNDSTASNTHSPGYTFATFTSSGSGTWASPIALDTASTAVRGAAICVDGAGKVFAFWGTGASGAASDIKYNTVASPYTAAGTAVNLTNASTNDNTQPHVPGRARVKRGYVPLIYLKGTATPWSVQYDNSISASSGNTAWTPASTETLTVADSANRVGVFKRQDIESVTTSDLVAAARIFLRTAGEIVGSTDAALRSLILSRNQSETSTGTDSPSRLGVFLRALLETETSADTAQALKLGAPPMTMASDVTKTTSWTVPSSSSDTETGYTAQNVAGDGFRLGVNPSYGGMPFSTLYEMAGGSVVNASENSTNPGSQISMTTTSPDGHIHLLANTTATTDGSFAGSEDKTFTITEQAPTQTAVRRYIKTSTVTANGIQYTIWACVYPGDPGLIAYRIDAVAGGAVAMNTAGATDNIEICSPAGLLSNTGTSTNQGVWKADATHSYYGTVGGTTTGGIPDGTSANTAGEPDFLAFLPLSGVASLTNQRLGLMAAKFTKWADVGLTAAGFASLSNTNRVKSKWGGNAGSTLAAGTYTFYLLEAFKTSLSTTQMAAIAADYLSPGSPTATPGTLTTFSYPNHSTHPFNLDEACYVVNAASNQAVITLDMSPANVTVRYCPRYKFTNYTASGKPIVLWGGTRLTETVDYNTTVDTTNHVCYVHVQRDVVASGAVGSQLNNAALTIQTSWVAALTESIGIADAVNRLSILARSGSEIVTETDANGRKVTYTRIDTETATAADTPNRALALARQVIDAVLASDAATRSVGAVRATIDATVTNDTAQRSTQYLRQALDLVTTSDVVQGIKNGGGAAWTAAVSETVALVDAVSRRFTGTRSTSEAATAGESGQRQVGIIRSALDTASVADVPQRVHGAIIAATESVNAGDTFKRAGTWVRGVAESVGITDLINAVLRRPSTSGTVTITVTEPYTVDITVSAE